MGVPPDSAGGGGGTGWGRSGQLVSSLAFIRITASGTGTGGGLNLVHHGVVDEAVPANRTVCPDFIKMPMTSVNTLNTEQFVSSGR